MKPIKLTKRELAALANKGVLRQRLDGSIEQIATEAAPLTPVDNTKRTWRVDGIERGWDGFITSVVITENG